MRKLLPFILVLLSFTTTAEIETVEVSSSLNFYTPINIQEPDLFSEPIFDINNLSNGYLPFYAFTTVSIPDYFSSIKRICIKVEHNINDNIDYQDKSGVKIFTYRTDQLGNKTLNTAIGSRENLQKINTHCLDESSWIYSHILTDRSINFTPYTNNTMAIANVSLLITGDISKPIASTEQVVTDYFNSLQTTGFNGSAIFFHPDTLEDFKDSIMALFENGSSFSVLRMMTFGMDVPLDVINTLSPEDFMNRFLNIIKNTSGSNTLIMKSFHYLGEIDDQDKRYALVKIASVVNRIEITRVEVVPLILYENQWKLDLTAQLDAIVQTNIASSNL
ncbi:hypothetical protein HQQ94_19065 [Shewanella sp. VB17]|uniref:hypothetical protein n=1 Tax=Shewanella sp. VB17 TaxID=2739432 RepID=UPI00156351D4|nr:hypothetical protein [Shewanella sp. VB17]NRD75284.1 hypothetical protein [Shewanella sp. VB17]